MKYTCCLFRRTVHLGGGATHVAGHGTLRAVLSCAIVQHSITQASDLHCNAGGSNPRVDSWPPQQQRLGFGKAVWRLHSTIFAPYRVWADHQRVADFPEKQVSSMWEGPLDGHHQMVTGLLDLCVYFCLWTEAANLKHMPESLWFLYWCA
jgi:hypothetical protein